MTMMRILRNGSLALIVSLGFSGMTIAQPPAPPPEGAQPPAPPPAEAQQPEFSDSQLRSFVAIQGDLEEIRTEYSARLEGIDDPGTAQALQQEARQEMVAAVEARNLSVEAYNQIAMALQQDPELLQRVQQMIEQG